jgi:hypothetical protein
MAGATGLQDRERYNDSNPHPALPLRKTQLRPVGFLARVILAGVALKSQRRGRAAAQRQAIRGQGRFYMGRSLYQGRQRLMPLHGPTVLRSYAPAPPQTVMKIVTTL